MRYARSGRSGARLIGMIIVLATLSLSSSVGSPPAFASGANAAAAAGSPTGGTSAPRSCGWVLEPTSWSQNVLFPDTATEYLGAAIPVPPGGYIEIDGQFPHARYMSLQAYSTTLQTTSDLRDTQIVPNPGSVNPFFAGADRTATNRSYTVKLVAGKPPASGPAQNTLYDTSPSGQSGHGFALRIYLPDQGTGEFGGVPAPSITLVLAGGARVPLPDCAAPPSTQGVTNFLAASNTVSWAGLPSVGLLAPKVPTWHKYMNAANGYAIALAGNGAVPAPIVAALASLGAVLPAGLGENADNKYIYAEFSPEWGKVVEIHAQMPTTPKTYAGEATMGTGDMRYWSMCTGETGTQTIGCVADEQVPVDSSGDYTVVVSTPQDRPADATSQCGVAWLPWGPEPQVTVLMRNMLPSPGFTHAVQNATQGTEKQVLGPYYPNASYFSSPAAFDQQVGCHTPTAPSSSRSPSRSKKSAHKRTATHKRRPAHKKTTHVAPKRRTKKHRR